MYKVHPNYTIHNLDALTYAGNPANLRDIETLESAKGDAEKRYIFIEGDVCDGAFLDPLFKEYSYDLVVHFAAETHVDRSISNAAKFIRTNIEGTRSLMELVHQYKTPRFVNISTDEIYGSVDEGYSDEDAPIRPSNPYATSKAGADLLVQSYIKTYGIPAMIVRGSNNYGPYQYPEKLIPMSISNLMENKKIPLHGTGEHMRSWLHVEDFAAAIDSIAHDGERGTIYNVAGEHMSNLEILGHIARRLGKNLADHKEHVADRPGADMRYAPSAKRLETQLGWKRTHSVASSIKEVVDWYKENEQWWRDIKETEEFRKYYDKQAKAQWY